MIYRCVMFIDRFPQKSPMNSGSFAKRDLQLKASCASLSPCTKITRNLIRQHSHISGMDRRHKCGKARHGFARNCIYFGRQTWNHFLHVFMIKNIIGYKNDVVLNILCLWDSHLKFKSIQWFCFWHHDCKWNVSQQRSVRLGPSALQTWDSFMVYGIGNFSTSCSVALPDRPNLFRFNNLVQNWHGVLQCTLQGWCAHLVGS